MKGLTPSEHDLQSNVIQWKNHSLGLYPELRVLFAIPNGGGRPKMQNKKGQWFSPTANKLKAEGLVSGVPDLLLAVSRCGYNSLYVEMKTPDGKLSDDQIEFQALLRQYNNAVTTAYDDMVAIEIIKCYLNDNKSELKKYVK